MKWTIRVNYEVSEWDKYESEPGRLRTWPTKVETHNWTMKLSSVKVSYVE